MISVNETKTEFHLQTHGMSYILKIAPSGHITNLYCGRRIRHRESFASLDRHYSTCPGNSIAYTEADDGFCLDTVRLELPTLGKGDNREAALRLRFGDGTSTCDFRFQAFRVLREGKRIPGLPSLRGDEIETLEIDLYDPVVDVHAILFYSLFEGHDIIARRISVINGSKGEIDIEKAMSINIDFDRSDFRLRTLDGKWIREFQVTERELSKGLVCIDSKKGVSGSNHNPFLCLASPQCDEFQGEAYGLALVYSGNHYAGVEVSPHDFTRAQLGINPNDWGWHLERGESFNTPEAVLSYSAEGLNGLSGNFHDLVKNLLVPPQWRHRERPILINNWEATYFDFDHGKLLRLAKKAKDLGIELFVLDDGWFGKRDDDRSSLGDWKENRAKLPGGLEALSSKIRALGLKFGLWVEPEMVSPESDLFKAHPNWAIRHGEREPSLGRHQLILDLANPEVIDYLYATLKALFSRVSVDYVKWDMNRNFSDVQSNSLPPSRQKEFAHRYVLGLYALIDRLTKTFPDTLFESCSSGGNRFDLGMLYYMPQTWTSDNTDALERSSIQYGASFLYPQSTMGAHVSGSPSHQVLRTTPIETRFNVAAFGLLGYELDLNRLSPFDEKAIRAQIAYYKKHRKLLQFGTFYRLESPFKSNHCLWMVVSEDKSEALIGYYQKLQEASPGIETLRLRGLNEGMLYELEVREQYINIRSFGTLIDQFIPIKLKQFGLLHGIIGNRYLMKQESETLEAFGDELMYAGFKPKSQFIGTGMNDMTRFIGDFGSRIYYLKKK